MNREHLSPNDPMFEPETPEVSQQRDEIERRLKATRPRPTRLDALALEQLAGEPIVDTPICPRPYGHITAIAGSWACGAVVGALVMFVLLNASEPETDSPQESVRIEKEPPVPPTPPEQNAASIVEEDPSPPEQFDPLGIDSAILAMTLDRFGSADSPYLSEGPTLRAGMYRIRDTEDRTANAMREVRTERPPRRYETPRPDPEPPVTRQRLMRDLLGESPEFVL